jgi:hypothetical protein
VLRLLWQLLLLLSPMLWPWRGPCATTRLPPRLVQVALLLQPRLAPAARALQLAVQLCDAASRQAVHTQ